MQLRVSSTKAIVGLGLFIGLLFVIDQVPGATGRYTPDWASLDARPLPSWYDQAKFGIFIHWGVFSVPSYACDYVLGEWYWYGLENGVQCIVDFHNKTYGPDFKYADFARSFKPALFDPDEWASLFAAAGAKYVVLTSKHHEGYCNWPSAQSWNWNSVDVGPHQDNVDLVTQAVRKVGLRMGLYHSLFEWFNPLYLADKQTGGKTTIYPDQILQPQLYDIVNRYKPEVVWADGDWDMSDTYWKSKEFLAWLYNDSPVKDSVVVNDRWGSGDTCKHGGYWTCSDGYNPGHLVVHKWENCLTMDMKSWGYARNSNFSDYRPTDELLFQLVSTVSCGGNLLLNVGPTSDGRIDPIFQDRLLKLGAFLKVNGEAIYMSTPWRVQNDTIAGTVWYTARTDLGAVYATLLEWPTNGKQVLYAPIASKDTTVTLMGVPGRLNFTTSPALTVTMPTLTPSQYPNPYAWVLKLTNVK